MTVVIIKINQIPYAAKTFRLDYNHRSIDLLYDYNFFGIDNFYYNKEFNLLKNWLNVKNDKSKSYYTKHIYYFYYFIQ